jgi:hypothetical protein
MAAAKAGLTSGMHQRWRNQGVSRFFERAWRGLVRDAADDPALDQLVGQ